MRSLEVSDQTRYNPIVADQIALLYDSIQEEICGLIVSTLGNLEPYSQLTVALIQKYYKNVTLLSESCETHSWEETTHQYPFQMPDPYSIFAGYFDIVFWSGLHLVHRSEVFFYYDFRNCQWRFQTKQNCPVQITHDPIHSQLIVQTNRADPNAMNWNRLVVERMRAFSR